MRRLRVLLVVLSYWQLLLLHSRPRRLHSTAAADWPTPSPPLLLHGCLVVRRVLWVLGVLCMQSML
jgi:hypothetical protein